GKIVLHNLDLKCRHLLEALQNVKAATTTVALQRVSRIRHQLQFPQDELWCHDDAVQEAGFGNVGDAPVDDHTGVEDLVTLLALLFAAKNSTQRRQVQQVALAGAYDQAHISHQQHYQNLQETLRAAGRHTAADYEGEQ